MWIIPLPRGSASIPSVILLKQPRLNRRLSRALLKAKTDIDSAGLSGFESNAAMRTIAEIGRLADALGIERRVIPKEVGLPRS